MFHNTWNMNIRWLISLALLLTLVIPVWAGGDTGCGCISNSYCDCTSIPSPSHVTMKPMPVVRLVVKDRIVQVRWPPCLISESVVI